MTHFTSIRAILALLLREMASSEGRLRGGYLWVIFEPIAAVLLLSLAFSAAFHRPPLGQDFALFYATGYLPFALYSDVAQKIGVALRFSRPLLAYPAVSWMDALLARLFLASVTQTIIITLVLGSLTLWSRDMIAIDPIRLATGFGLALLMGASTGVLNAYLFGAFPIWERLWSIANRPLFLVSAVVFLPETLPHPYDHWLGFNPLVHAVSEVRAGLYPAYEATWPEPGSMALAALVPLAIGLALLLRHAHEILHEA